MEPNATQTELAHLLRVSWIVLIPAGVLLSLVLYKLAMLLHSLLEFLNLARYELAPALKDVRLIAEHVELLSDKAATSVKSIEQGVSATVPALQSLGHRLQQGLRSFWAGIGKSFNRK